MSDEMERLLRRYYPAGPPAHIREKILRRDLLLATPRRLWPMRLFRTAVAALLLLSLGLLHAADRLNQDSAARSGLGSPHWTAEAQQAADIMGGDPASRQYIAICLVAGNGHSSRSLSSQGVDR
jgi:hypothetical protein